MNLTLNKTAKLMAGLCVAAIMAFQPLAASAESMAGKTITLIHNASPGGSTGLGAQILANYWSKAIEGEPTMIVQSVPGGALTKGINQARNAKPDGTTIGYVAWSGSTRILDDPALQIPFEKLGLIGGVGGTSQMISIRTDAGDGISNPGDFAKLDEVVFGGYSVKSMPSMSFAAAFDLLGLDWTFVSGFFGDTKISAAQMRGEIEAGMSTASYYRTQLKDGAVADGEIMPVFYLGAPTADGKDIVKTDAYGEIALPFSEYYRNITGKDPSGPEWELIKFNGTNHEPVIWLIFAPEGTPDETMKTLRNAFVKASTDPAYIAEATKLYGAEPLITSGQAIIDRVKSVQGTTEEMKDILRTYIAKLKG